MQFDMEQATSILRRTPSVFDALLRDLPDPWVASNEGENTWSPLWPSSTPIKWAPGQNTSPC